MTDEQLRELRGKIKREALLEYAAALESNRSADYWDRDDILYDIRDWANDVMWVEQHAPE